MTGIKLDPVSPEEASAFSKDAGWAQVARLAVRKGFTQRDWKCAMRAFRIFVDGALLSGQPKKGLTPLEVEAWFDTWYTMLTLRRIVELQDYLRGGEGA